jgi:hypothetical protein
MLRARPSVTGPDPWGSGARARALLGTLGAAAVLAASGCAQPPPATPKCPSCPSCPPAAAASAGAAPSVPSVPPRRTPAGVELPPGDWQETAGDTVTFHHLAAHAADAERFRGWFSETHAALAKAFPEADVAATMKDPVACHVWLMPAPTALVGAGRTRSSTSSGKGGTWCEIYFLAPSAMTDADRCCTLVGEPRDESYLRKVVAHEYGGIFLHRQNRIHAGWRFGSAPLWFVQGYEEWLALQLASEHSRTVTFGKYKALVADEPGRIGFFGVANEFSDGAVLLAFLHEEFGAGKVRAVLRSKKKSFSEALEAELGVNAEALLQRWTRWRKKALVNRR